MKEKNNPLLLKVLPANLLIKGFVKNMDECNYENYLTEFINASSYFMEKTGGIYFKYQNDQSNGQCDCYAKTKEYEYAIDYKLFGSQNALYGRSVLSNQITEITLGAYAFSQPRENKNIIASNILETIKDVTLEELEDIVDSKYAISEKTIVKRDIQGILRILRVKKNLLLFLTYQFLFPRDYHYDFEEEKEGLLKSISKRMKNIIIYRNELVENYDTFLCFLFENHLIITEFTDCGLKEVDVLPIDASPLFMKLSEIGDVF